MNYDIFLMPLLISFVVAATLLVAFISLGRKISFRDVRVSKRHIHKKGISRFGGVAMIVSFVVAILLDEKLIISAPLIGVLFGSIAIMVLGVIDDFNQVSWKTQLFFQFVIVMAVYIMGVKLEYITNPLGGVILFQDGFGYILGLIISIVWVVFLMNAMNWVDGVDGVAGGVTLVGVVVVFLLSLRPDVNQPPIAIITAALAGGIIAFILFNFHPAKIFAGSSGAIFMGFILAIMAIFAGAKIATTLLVLAVPIIDALWVICERYSTGDSIFSPDKRHLHFRLMELGWSSKKICFFYYGITIIVALLALNSNALGKIVVFFSIVLLMGIALFIVRDKAIIAQKN